MIVRAVIFIVLSFTMRVDEVRAAPLRPTMEEANVLYQAGDCAGAVSIYRRFYYGPDTVDEDKDFILFRTSYCYLQLGQLEAAADGFHSFLKRYPENEEARLRLAQALLQLRKFGSARDHALAVQNEPFLTEAILVAAQAEIELGETESAVRRLNQARVNNEWRPVFFYWLGVAKAREHDLRLAEAYFRYAGGISPPDHWVRQETFNWIEQIQNDKATRGTLVLGYFYDSNLSQQSILATDNRGTPIEVAPNESSYYSDSGYYIGAELSYRFIRKKKWDLGVFASGSTTYYDDFTSFNNQSLTGGLSATYQIDSRFTASLFVKYLTTRYDFRYYQDYVIATPGITFAATENLLFHFEIPYTWYVRTRFSETYGPALSGRYLFQGGSLFAGLSYARTKGEKATFYVVDSLAYVLSGDMFSSYETQGRFIGATLNLPWNLFATLQLSSYVTDYDGEGIPANAVQSASNARSDDLITYGADLTWVPVPNTLAFSLAYNYSENESTGLQGLTVNNQVSDYNYNRSYLLLSSTLSF